MQIPASYQYSVVNQNVAAIQNPSTVPPVNPNVCQSYSSLQSKVIGTLQIIISVALFIIFYATPSTRNGSPGPVYIGHVFWWFCTILYILAGAFGIWAASNKTKCVIVAYLVLCVCSVPAAIIFFIYGMLTASATKAWHSNQCENRWPYTQTAYRYDCESNEYMVVVIMSYCLAILAFAEIFLAVFGSVISCRVVCCGSSIAGVVMTTPFSHPQGVILNLQGQPNQASVFVQGYQVNSYQVQQPGMLPPQYVQPSAPGSTVPPSFPYGQPPSYASAPPYSDYEKNPH